MPSAFQRSVRSGVFSGVVVDRPSVGDFGDPNELRADERIEHTRILGTGGEPRDIRLPRFMGDVSESLLLVVALGVGLFLK